MKSLGAKIISLKQFAKLRPRLKGKIVMTGGGFDPIHPGHVSLILESKKYGDVLVVIVNGDWFLKNKKGKAFQDLRTRSLIVSGLRGVDYVVPFEIKNDIDHRLERPDTYIGTNEIVKEKIFIYENKQLLMKKIAYNPAFFKS